MLSIRGVWRREVDDPSREPERPSEVRLKELINKHLGEAAEELQRDRRDVSTLTIRILHAVDR